MGEIGWVLGVSLLGRVKSGAFLGASLLGNGKSGAFLAYPDGKIWNLPNFARTRVGAQKHTPRNVPRQRFGSKIGCVLGVSVCGNVKPAKFCTYPCRGVLHTPRNVLRRRFGPKTGQVLGISLLGKCETRQIFHIPV